MWRPCLGQRQARPWSGPWYNCFLGKWHRCCQMGFRSHSSTALQNVKPQDQRGSFQRSKEKARNRKTCCVSKVAKFAWYLENKWQKGRPADKTDKWKGTNKHLSLKTWIPVKLRRQVTGRTMHGSAETPPGRFLSQKGQGLVLLPCCGLPVHRSGLAALGELRAHEVSGELVSRGSLLDSTSPAPGSRCTISAREVHFLSTWGSRRKQLSFLPKDEMEH